MELVRPSDGMMLPGRCCVGIGENKVLFVKNKYQQMCWKCFDPDRKGP
jgi:hypothetical protein